MNNNLVSYEVAESPKKTTGVIVGVTLVVLGIGAVVLYFVRESAKADKPFSNQAERDLIRQVQQENGNVSTLLDKLSNFGLNKGQSTSSSTASTSSGGTSTASGGYIGSGVSVGNAGQNVGCNNSFNKNQDVIEIPDGINKLNMHVKLTEANINKCGRGVLEFQTYVRETTGIDIPLDGRYGNKTRKAHKRWLEMQNLV
jgi:hypothetical protein